MRDSMLFYKSYLDAVEMVKDKSTQLKLLKTIINYGLTGDADIKDDPVAEIAWVFIKEMMGG